MTLYTALSAFSVSTGCVADKNTRSASAVRGRACGQCEISAHRVVWISCLYPHLSQHPDAIGEFHRLVEHVLTLHRTLGYGEDVATLQLVGGCVC